MQRRIFSIPKLGMGWNIYFVIPKVYDYNGIAFGICTRGLEVLVGLAYRITKAQGPGRHTASRLQAQESSW